MLKGIILLSQCFILLRYIIPCSGHQVSTTMKQRRAAAWSSSSLENFLVLSKVGIDIEDNVLYNREELIILLQRQFRALIYFPTALSNEANVSRQCIKDSLFYVEDLFIRQAEWALKMLEASAQLPIGMIANRNFHAEGMFDECLSIRSVPERVTGQYCTLFFKWQPESFSSSNDTSSSSKLLFNTLNQVFGLSTNLKIKPTKSNANIWTLHFNYPSVSLCLPSSCSASDLGEAVANIIGSFVISNQSIVTISDESFCFSDDAIPRSFDGLDIAVISMMCFIGLLLASATYHDVWRSSRGAKFEQTTDNTAVTTLHCFSLRRNTIKFLNCDSANHLSCLNGVRAITTFWIFAIHIIMRMAGLWRNGLTNPKAVDQIVINNWTAGLLGNGSVGVDSLIFISGLLVSYALLAKLDRKGGKFEFGSHYLHRYLRVTPAYAFVLAFVATVMVYLGSGPEWFPILSEAKSCRETWWQHMLYGYNLNYLNVDGLCMRHSWSLDVDMQLFLIAPIFIYSLWRWRKFGVALLSSFTIGSLAYSAVLFAVNDKLPMTYLPIRWKEHSESFWDFAYQYYSQAWTRAPPYMVGIFIGWFLHQSKHSKLTLSRVFVVSMWILSIFTIGFIIFCLFPYYDEAKIPTIHWIVRSTYGSLHRFVWSLSLAWIVVACIHGYSGFVNSFLSWRGFRPLSKLSFCIYLIHLEFMNWYYAVARRKLYRSVPDALVHGIGIFVLVCFLSFLLHVCIEVPFLNLESYFFPQSRKEKTENVEDTKENNNNSFLNSAEKKLHLN